MPSEDVWLSGVFGGKSVSLECINGQSERSRADFRHFQASFEDLLLRVILDVTHVQRIRDFLVMCYINVRFTYLLTYLVRSFKSISVQSIGTGVIDCHVCVLANGKTSAQG